MEQQIINGAEKATILIVDDMPENLAVLGELLQDDYRVRVASSGRRALEIVETAPRPELILLDIMMPDMDGYQVLTKLRQSADNATIPVIFITALDAMEDEQKGFSLGAVDYITKPLRPAIVQSRIAAHLQLKRANDRLRDQNSYLEAEVQRRMHENQLIQDISMRALASLAETRDNETGNHILRTQHYVELLAKQLSRTKQFATQLTPQAISLMTKAAPLHDIGKVGIPDHILLKPAKLTADEWVIMKTHCQLGSDAIESAMRGVDDHTPLAFLHVAMDIAYSHHERWDGTGYPEGMVAEQIPLSARLMAVADVFDALISKRVYKDAMPVQQASEIIISGRGSHFDPVIVDAFIACQQQFTAIAQRFADL